MPTLRLYLDDSWPDHQPACDWALLLAGRISCRGRSAPEHWPLADEQGTPVAQVEVVLDPGQYSLHEVTLPDNNPAVRSRLIAYALEEQLLEATEQYHLVGASTDQDAQATSVIALLASRLKGILAGLEQVAGLPAPCRVIPAHELLPRHDDAWVAWQTPAARVLLYGRNIGPLLLDSYAALATLLASAGPHRPARLRALGPPREAIPTDLPLHIDEHFDWASADWRQASNLLVGDFRPTGQRPQLKAWRMLFLVAVGMLILHALGCLGEWAWWAKQERALKGELAQMVRRTLEEEPGIAPLGQLVVASDRIRHRRGEVGHGDFLGLARVASDIVGATRIVALHYGPGRIEFHLSGLDADPERTLREVFVRAGLDVRVSRGADGVHVLAAWMIPGAAR